MRSVKNLCLEELQLSEYSKKLFLRLSLPLEDVVMLVRTGDFPPYHDLDKVIKYKKRLRYLDILHLEIREINQLAYEVKLGLERLGAIRHDFYESERFRISASIFALQEAIEERFTETSYHYFDHEDYIPRLIRKLDNEAYEKWMGFSDDTIEQILKLLEGNLPEIDFAIICMKFGLGSDSQYKTVNKIAAEFGWTEGTVRYHIRKSIRGLYNVVDMLDVLTKIKL